MTFEEFLDFQQSLSYQRSSRLDRVHIGLVQLSTDCSLEMDWAKLSGTQAAVFSSRVYYSSYLTPEELRQIAAGIPASAKLIAQDLPMDVMVFGCTSASIVIGEEEVARLLTEDHPGIPATNPWSAAKASFSHFNAKKIAVFSPYTPEVNYALHQQLSASGFDVVRLGSLGIERDTEITFVSYDSVRTGLETLLKGSDAELVFLSCTNLRVLDHLADIEEEFGIPAVCSNAAMFWHAMELAGRPASCPGYGRLLSQG
ncbi:maleate isomerase-like [Saccostrea echinata]|uniref:maleate isomerase-like n=1 Tax=Saccostrea echinata TaxID=191078 RepID=UPI002A7F880F|nr:maleate isomerase-like [Saccostrea echinata]